jgi:tubulin polyglutamylase TTLL6/13
MAFARFCTESYEKPNFENMDNVFIHLTNYALNKDSEFYEENDEELDKGHKRSLGAILKILESEGADISILMDQVKDMIVKTVITGQPILSHEYKISQPECLDNSMAFQILGFDILIDSKFKP